MRLEKLPADVEPEIKRYVDRVVTNGKRSGLHLDDERRGKMEEMQKRISQLAIQFQENVGKENTKLLFEVPSCFYGVI